jgi:hypothetical protein
MKQLISNMRTALRCDIYMCVCVCVYVCNERFSQLRDCALKLVCCEKFVVNECLFTEETVAKIMSW